MAGKSTTRFWHKAMLTDAEHKMLTAYRQLPHDGQRIVIEALASAHRIYVQGAARSEHGGKEGQSQPRDL